MGCFYDEVRNYIYDELDNYEDSIIDADDFGFVITEGPNADGSITFSAEEARNILNDCRDDLGEIDMEIKHCYGSLQAFDGGISPFEEPEKYHVTRTIFVAERIVSEILDELGLSGEQVMLDAQLIADFRKKLDEQTGTSPF